MTAFSPLQLHGLPAEDTFDTLCLLIRELERVPAVTEKSFLQVGAKLSDLTLRFAAIADKSAAAAEFMSGKEILSIIEGLKSALDRMECRVAAANEKAELAVVRFGLIRDGLAGIGRLMANFQERVATLRMMKTLTNIQSASLGDAGRGFRGVAADIGKLSQNVQVKSVGIIMTARELSADLERALGMVAGLEAKQKNLSRVMVETIRHGIGSLAAMHEKCAAAAQGVSGRSGEISRDVGEVVMAMQFHDITRQQMQHARDALVDAGSSLRKGCGEGIALPAAAGDRCDILADLGSVCELQAAQLTNTVDNLQSAVGRITVNLRKVSRNAADASARVHALSGLADGIGRSSMGEIESGLASVLAVFSENAATNRELTGVMASVTEAMGAIAAFLEDIDDIGAEIKLIALNAIIKAAQAGSGGAALNVIAQTVKGESEVICRQVTVITDTILGIAGHLDGLRGEIGAREGEAAREAEEETMQIDLWAFLDALRTLNDAVMALLKETDLAAGTLAADVEEAITAIRMEEGVAALKDGIIPSLNVLAISARAAKRAARSRGVGAGEQHYTMRSERDVHAAFVAVAKGGEAASFGNLAAGLPRFGESGFGDNVEFF